MVDVGNGAGFAGELDGVHAGEGYEAEVGVVELAVYKDGLDGEELEDSDVVVQLFCQDDGV